MDAQLSSAMLHTPRECKTFTPILRFPIFQTPDARARRCPSCRRGWRTWMLDASRHQKRRCTEQARSVSNASKTKGRLPQQRGARAGYGPIQAGFIFPMCVRGGTFFDVTHGIWQPTKCKVIYLGIRLLKMRRSIMNRILLAREMHPCSFHV